MSNCRRGCCWTPHQACARARECPCHWGDWLITAAQHTNNGPVTTYSDPTSNQAINNVMKERGERR
jgi:hypothetical protein